MNAPLHVLDVAAHADTSALLGRIDALERHGVRVSVLCAAAAQAEAVRQGTRRSVLIGALDDDPWWTTIRLAASWSQQERVDVLRAHDSASHVLAVLAGALCECATVALLGSAEVPMLDLEAHRMGDAAYLCAPCEAALAHARAIGVSPARLQLVDRGWPAEVQDLAMVDLLRRAALSEPAASTRERTTAALLRA